MTVRSGDEVAALVAANAELGHPGGVLVANPIPETDELDPDRINTAIAAALAEAEATGVQGPGVTPAVLAAIAAATDGESVPANLALAENNARVGAEIAVAMAARS
jgi:pseudouridine-5'-phosphate glycosidase